MHLKFAEVREMARNRAENGQYGCAVPQKLENENALRENSRLNNL